MVWETIKGFFKGLFKKNKEVIEKPVRVELPPVKVDPPVKVETPIITPNEFGDIEINMGAINELVSVKKKILDNQERYLAVQDATGVPWKLIAGLHYRESSLRFDGCLHNGDPWNKPTVNVPKGRGPFSSWHESAIDAILLEQNKFPKQWDFAGQMFFAERFNGLGYKNRGLPSPYVYASTNKYTAGLYVADGRFDARKVDKRLGVAAIVMWLS